ncbi:Uncharacterised protein [Klebsiella pneumoniae]|nr:Uncharacterised protein [Klebsiella pneumoniae]
MNNPPALAPNSTSSGQINGVCSSRGIARLLSSSTRPQPPNRPLRETRSASQPIGSCNNASPTTTVLTMASATACGKPWRNPYTGSRVRIIASKAANNTTAQAIAGRPRQKAHKPRPEALCGSTLGAPLRPSSSNEPAISRQTPNQKPRSSAVPMKVSSTGPDSWLRA